MQANNTIGISKKFASMSLNNSNLRLFFFFFLMIRLPPISTLFPYTTLFRSYCRHESFIGESAGGRIALRGEALQLSVRQPACADLEERRAGAPSGDLRDRDPGPSRFADAEDRKSTRLNSSHLVLCYAVFCFN